MKLPLFAAARRSLIRSRKTPSPARIASSRRRLIERLEARRVMDATPIISEFLAANSGGLRDEDGESSDWIELYNPTASSINLEGWFLTDDPNDLNAWQFPAVSLPANEFLVLFASGKDRATAGNELHTNFRLSTAGDYLALSQPDGTIVSEFAPSFPAQVSNVSYGASFVSQTLFSKGSESQFHVPSSNALGLSWTEREFVPSGWNSEPLDLGFGLAEPGFEVTYVKANVNVTSLSVALDVLSNPNLQSATAQADFPVVNFLGSGSSARYLNDFPFPTQSVGDDYDDFVIEAIGNIAIPSSGQWTFGVNSDDGFSLQLERNGVVFSSQFAGLRGPADTLATFNIPEPGDWQATLVMFERGGGAEVELFAAPGNFTQFNASAFDLVGDVANGGLAASHGLPVSTNVQEDMLGVNATIFVRIPFIAEDLSDFDSLVLDIAYEDGFVAYLNGTEVARRNTPQTLPYNANALSDRPLSESTQKERISLSDYLHLLEEGENVLALHGLNDAVSDSSFLLDPTLTLLSANANTPRYFSEPTPGALNGQAYLGIVERVSASLSAGFYEDSQTVSLTTPTAGATIRYTLDGSTPSPTHGLLYSDPIIVSATTTLRAGAFLTDYVALPTISRTYLFLDDVVSQAPSGAPPAGWPATWGNNVVDYGMDPDVVSSVGPNAVKQALLAIPSLAVSTDLENLFDSVTGIYGNAYGDGREWERPASLELLNPDGSPGFQVNAGIRIRGGFSRSPDNPKHSFRFFFRGEYGDGSLEYPLFGDEGVQSFKKIDLRTAQNYSWSFGGDSNNTFIADVFARESQRDMNQPYTRSRWYHLYIDGQYWGLYQTQERAEAEFAASYFGGNASDYDVLKPEAGPYNILATDGNAEAYRRLWEAAVTGFTDHDDYMRVQGRNPDGTDNQEFEVLLDVDNLIVYMVNILYGGNLDAPISDFLGNTRINNFFAVRDRTGRDGFRFFLHDSEHTLLPWRLNENRNGPYSAGSEFQYFNPQWLHQQLMANTEYRIRFADIVQSSFYGDGPLTVAAAQARYQNHINQLDQAIVAESARWGDAKRPDSPLGRPHWLAATANVRDNYLTQRGNIVLNQWRANGLFPAVNAATFLLDGVPSTGGITSPGSNLRFAAVGGIVYYMTDGTDPRLPGGDIHPDALVYDPMAETLTLVATESIWKYWDQGTNLGTAWRSLSFNDSNWSQGSAELGYGDGDEATIVGFGPNSSNKYITTYFRRNFTVTNANDVTALRLRLKRDDGAVVYLNGHEVARSNMPAGSITFTTLASNAVGGEDESRYYEFTINPALLNSGDNILAIEIHQSAPSSSDLSFDAELTADTQSNPGLTINEPINVVARVRTESGEWSAISEAVFNTAVPATAGSLIITEIMYNPPAATSAEPQVDKEEFEWAELRNISDVPVSLSGVRFAAGVTFDFSLGSVPFLLPGQNVIVARNLSAFRGRYGDSPLVAGTYGDTGTNFSNGGELVTLVGIDAQVIQSFTYDDAAPWPTSPDGAGTSLTLRWVDRSDDLPTNWRASYVPLGTPGFEENDYPENLALSSNLITENNSHALIGTLSADDPNLGDQLTYELRPDEDGAQFTIVGNELRVAAIGLDFEAGHTRNIVVRTRDAAGLFVDTPLLIEIIDLPEVENVVIGNGTQQRSLVNQVVLTFDGQVTIDPNAFSVLKRGASGGDVTTSFTTQTNGAGQTVATLSFSGSFTRGIAGALSDGSYQLTIDANKIRRGTVALDGDRNGSAGGQFSYGSQASDNFFALFGDLNGDRTVSLPEFNAFRSTFGRAIGDAAYRAELDYDGNGLIGLADFNEFRGRFGRLMAFE